MNGSACCGCRFQSHFGSQAAFLPSRKLRHWLRGPLRDCRADHVGGSTFSPGIVDTFYNVIVGLPALDGAIHVYRLGIVQRAQQLKTGGAAWCSIDVIACYRIIRATGLYPT